MRKFIILFLVVVVIAMFALPTALFAPNGYHYTITITKTASGFDSGDFSFDIWIYNPLLQDPWKLASTKTIGNSGGSVSSVFGSSYPSFQFRIVESGTNGATGVTWSFDPNPNAQNGVINNTSDDFTVTGDTWHEPEPKIVYFDNIKKHTSSAPEPETWVRPMPMTVWQVFINEDNDFQFIFWYPYKDNNWVRIYDMKDNMVYETDLPINDPNLIVDLPDGFYMVRTYHHDTLLQEFLIGKP